MLAGNAAYDPAATWLIQRVNGTGSSGSITFSSIPQTYQHLQVRIISRDTTATNADIPLNLRLGNGSIDTGANYARHYLEGNGTSVSASGVASASTIQMIRASAGGGSTANIHGVSIIDIHDYTSTTKNKTVRSFNGVDFNNANGALGLTSGLWMSTSAVNTLRVYLSTGSFTTSTSIALYGYKG